MGEQGCLIASISVALKKAGPKPIHRILIGSINARFAFELSELRSQSLSISIQDEGESRTSPVDTSLFFVTDTIRRRAGIRGRFDISEDDNRPFTSALPVAVVPFVATSHRITASPVTRKEAEGRKQERDQKRSVSANRLEPRFFLLPSC
ncbi:hypothetical protein BT69DRAFT_1290895 [Atractiella rhizophila]|nr:hypothetical protein BT69DRAFT_1290895 [Atractiella rhizophila]